jgi:predicted phosphodiesterase
VFTGHSHVANKATVMGVPYLNTGSLKNGEVLRMHIEEKQILEEFKSL